MSWSYLQGEAEASWPGASLDGAPSALSKLIPTHGESFSHGNETEHCPDSPYGMISEFSMVKSGRGISTSLPGDSHAPTLAQPESVSELPAKVRAFGSRCLGLLGKSNLRLSSRKTARSYVLADLSPSSKDLPAWGMTVDGVCWELGTSARLISEIDCGYWPTPNTMTGGQTSRSGSRKGEKLIGGLARGLHDPKTCNHGGECRPTLNPQFVEWLMGWPIGWTDLEPLEMGTFRMWQQWLGIS